MSPLVLAATKTLGLFFNPRVFDKTYEVQSVQSSSELSTDI